MVDVDLSIAIPPVALRNPYRCDILGARIPASLRVRLTNQSAERVLVVCPSTASMP